MTVRHRRKGTKYRESTVQVVRAPKAPAKQEAGTQTAVSMPEFDDMRKQVVITVLTGARPILLMKTLRALSKRAPKLVEQAKVVALVNGSDEQSLTSLGHVAWVNTVHKTPTLLPIGDAFSLLMREALDGERRYVLHLEDDWECCVDEDAWLPKAVRIINDEGVGQVRLRLARDMVMSVNALSHQKIIWKKQSDTLSISKNAHFTFNPSLVPTTVMQSVHPCTSEVDAMGKFGVSKLSVAQLSPGAFMHIGGAESLADKTGGR